MTTQHKPAETADADDAGLVGQTLQSRFRILDEVGRGGQGITWLGRDEQTGAEVAVKQLAVDQMGDWKELERFEREVDSLQRVDHPAVPQYVDAFQAAVPGPDGRDEQRRHFLVRAYVDGEDLETRIERGEAFTEDDARAIAVEILDALEAIHSLEPPIIHRDVKPANIIVGDDGYIHLVDFGAAHHIVSDEAGGSSLMGTSGYMPMEQTMGRALPASDLYALGVTLVRMLSRRPIAELPVQRMRLQYDSYVDISDGFRQFLDKLLAPYADDRFQSAAEARRALDIPAESPQFGDGAIEEAPDTRQVLDVDDLFEVHKQREAFHNGHTFDKPLGSQLSLTRDGDSLVLWADRLEALPSRKSGHLSAAAALGLFSLVWLAASFMNVELTLQGILDALGFASLGVVMGLGAWWFGKKGLWNLGKSKLEITPDRLEVRSETFGLSKSMRVGASTPQVRVGDYSALARLTDFEPQDNQARKWRIAVESGDEAVYIGQALAPAEKIWLASEIREFYEAR